MQAYHEELQKQGILLRVSHSIRRYLEVWRYRMKMSHSQVLLLLSQINTPYEPQEAATYFQQSTD